MILILSVTSDVTTSLVCDWLEKFNQPFLVITEKDEYIIKTIDSTNAVLKNIKTNKILDFSKIKVYWYRRGKLNLKYNETKNINIDFIRINTFQEKNTYLEYLYFLLEKKPKLDSYLKRDVNKLIVNKKASKLLNVPNYLCTDDKLLIKRFMNENGRCIVKPVTPGFNSLDEFISCTTKEVFKSDLINMDINFGVSYIQKMIEKRFEIKTFYLDEKFYSTAIFSQKNEKTKLDFRNYDYLKPNRQVPYILPKEIENNTHLLIKNLGLNSCSIDYIYGNDEKIYFLEINPVGQYGPVSYYGNYELEKKIAKYLIKLLA